MRTLKNVDGKNADPPERPLIDNLGEERQSRREADISNQLIFLFLNYAKCALVLNKSTTLQELLSFLQLERNFTGIGQ